jgi:ABC-type multidrug transport system ATPase subunit
VSEVLSISDRVLVIQQGRLIADTPVPEIRARARSSGRDVEQVVLDIVRQAAGTAAAGAAR